MLRKTLSDLGAILPEILGKDLPRTHYFMLRKTLSDLGAILPEILGQDLPRKDERAADQIERKHMLINS